MRFELDAVQKALVADVDQVCESLGRGADPRKVMEHLGRERLLAVHYPIRYGGRGLPLAAHAAVCERLGELELPDAAHLISVQAVGCAILAYGTDAQKDRYLPPLAGGLLFASLLLSEAGAGSDLAGIQTTAAGDGSGWRISGTKAWSLHTDWSGLALCSARTRRGDHRYDGISLFLIDLTAPGVRLVPVARASGTPYFTVTLDGVYVGEDALLGRLHRGWALLPTVIGFERTGFDYLTRATRWLQAAETVMRRLTAAEQAGLAADLVNCRSKIESARALSYLAVNSAQGLDMDEIAAAYAKLACGRAAQAVARWAGREFSAALAAGPSESDAPEAAVLRAAVDEAPEFTVSGGPQELQLDLIASEFPIGAVVRLNLDLDPSRKRLAEAAAAEAATQPEAASGWMVFDAVGVTELLTVPGGGSVFGLLDWCLVLESLGAGRRDLDLIREVRRFLDVFDDGQGSAREAFAAWVRNARAGTQARVLAFRRTAEDGSERWSTHGGPPELAVLPDVVLDPAAATAVRDRDLVACAAYAVGIGRGGLEQARERAGSRVIAARRLIEYQGTAHRLAESATELANARLAVWRSAALVDEGRVLGYRAAGAAAAAVAACLECAHTAVQIFGAAGTSDSRLVSLHRAAYRLTAVCGSPRALWQEAGGRALAEESFDAIPAR